VYIYVQLELFKKQHQRQQLPHVHWLDAVAMQEIRVIEVRVSGMRRDER